MDFSRHLTNVHSVHNAVTSTIKADVKLSMIQKSFIEETIITKSFLIFLILIT